MSSDNLRVFVCAINLLSQGCHCRQSTRSVSVAARESVDNARLGATGSCKQAARKCAGGYDCSHMFQLVACSRTTCICMLAGLVVLLSCGAIFW